jgi:hypothetical protein
MTLEADQKADILQVLMDETRYRKGKEVELITFAGDTVSPLKRVSSRPGIANEEELNQLLTELVQTLVPEGESRETLEKGFEEDPGRVIHHSHHDEIVTEWDTVIDGIVVGIRAIRDQRGESARTWYLRHGEAHPQQAVFLQEEKGPSI